MKGALLMVAIALWFIWMAIASLDPNWHGYSWQARLVALMPPTARFAFHAALAFFCGLLGIGLARIRLNIDQIDVRLDAIRVKSVFGWQEALWADVDHILYRATSPFPAIAVVRKNPTFIDHLLLRSRFGVLLRPDTYDRVRQRIPPQYRNQLRAYSYPAWAPAARPTGQLSHVVIVISLAVGGVILRRYDPFAFKVAVSLLAGGCSAYTLWLLRKLWRDPVSQPDTRWMFYLLLLLVTGMNIGIAHFVYLLWIR
ncbi:hypothetical protein FJW06_02485 [Mesorhizobium sp. B4-1-3]|uniref:hypothetical protein n=1 Tax=Mesorhizobium sp. B4-1-3 TaxID=2589889 RepID=UPI0011292D83|nr:hypothetical protein [Mesorhizobium sp. B4-1-3]TPI17196.1 hypothetical protein FJW06_02485 [Mesorhizobium sp. B4-1-3]